MNEEWKKKMLNYMSDVAELVDDEEDAEILKLALLADISAKLRGIELSLDAML